MKIQFDPNLDFQHEAIKAVVDLFDGQEVCQTNFTVAPIKHDPQTVLPGMENDLGIGNRLRLLDKLSFPRIGALVVPGNLRHPTLEASDAQEYARPYL